MEPRFEQFIRERQYLANVTPATIEWYKNSLKWLRSDSRSQADLRVAVLRMRKKGLSQPAAILQFTLSTLTRTGSIWGQTPNVAAEAVIPKSRT